MVFLIVIRPNFIFIVRIPREMFILDLEIECEQLKDLDPAVALQLSLKIGIKEYVVSIFYYILALVTINII